MAVITLTTDLGTSDHYVPSVKGTLLRHCPTAIPVDISHHIEPFNVLEAAFVLRASYAKFPDETLHIVGVDPQGGNQGRTVLMRLHNQWFIAPDNGVLSLVKERDAAEVWMVDSDKMPPSPHGKAFLLLSQLIPAAAHLANGGAVEDIASPGTLQMSLWGEPAYQGNALRGTIIHIDTFGNAHTNILKEDFLRYKGDQAFMIILRNMRLKRIVSTYSDVPRGEALAIFAENGRLELALREGSAAQLLGLKVHDMFTIEFST